MAKSTLEITTQEAKLLTVEVEQVTVPTQLGDITILPGHAPLFARMAEGELVYLESKQGSPVYFAVTGGFVDVSPTDVITVLADTAVRSDQINLEKARAAVERAKKALAEHPPAKEALLIEAELRQALLQQKIAQRRQSS